MLKKTYTYTDFNGKERTEDYYFNLTKTELTIMELERDGGMSTTIDKIIKSQDAMVTIELFKKLILSSYGEKSPDGKRFIKSPELSEAFSQTVVFDIMFMELATHADLGSAFVNGIMPKELIDHKAKATAAHTDLLVHEAASMVNKAN